MKQMSFGFAHWSELADHIIAHLESLSRGQRVAAAAALSVHRHEDLLEVEAFSTTLNLAVQNREPCIGDFRYHRNLREHHA
jgi:hypothetical protein